MSIQLKITQPSPPRKSSIHPTKETLLFFPTCASLINLPSQNTQAWQIPIHGWIYRPADLSRLRRTAFSLMKHLAHLRFPQADLSSPNFQPRLHSFLNDNDRHQRIQISLHNQIFTLKKSRPDGHFNGQLILPTLPSPQPQSLHFQALTQKNDPRTFQGQVLLLPPTGISIISDIDDTIKITHVKNRRAMLRNTFLNEFQCVPGMPAFYHHLAQLHGPNTAFHYVSAGPWHLYPFLAEFLTAQGFPQGTFHLRDFRLMLGNLRAALRPPRQIKWQHARQLLRRFPHRKFILIGDSGEADPELYAKLAQKFPTQIQKIYIRNITQESPTTPRWQKLLKNLPPQKFQLFQDPKELAP